MKCTAICFFFLDNHRTRIRKKGNGVTKKVMEIVVRMVMPSWSSIQLLIGWASCGGKTLW